MPPLSRTSSPARRRADAFHPGVSPGVLVSAVLLFVSSGYCGTRAVAQETVSRTPAAPRQADEAAIRAAARAYLEALERGDGRALAAMWTADGDIVDDDGRVTNGRKTVASTAPRAEDASRPTVDLRESSLRFLSADVAVEDGEVKVTSPESTAVHTGHFTALWVKESGSWKLAGLRESRIGAIADSPKLADLAWMVGDWTVVDEAAGRRPGAVADAPLAGSTDQPAMEVSVRWDEGRAFLVREMKIVRKTPNGPSAASHITQRIGWDPLSRQLRSWSFSSDGGHAESIWTRDGDTWIARAVAVMPDGTQTSSLNLYSYDGADRYTWRSLPTHVGGEHLPQVTMTMARKKGGDGR